MGGRGWKGFSHAERVGDKMFWTGAVLKWELEVLAILKGAAKRFNPLKRGHKKSYLVLRANRKTRDFWTCDFPIMLPPPPRLCY